MNILAENGKSFYTITIPSGADRVLRFAAKELAKYLKQMTGASFPVGNAGGRKGKSLEIRAEKAELPDEKDSFELRPQGESLLLWGINPRSALYAVYDFLEELGCSFVEPGIDIVPARCKLAVDFPVKKTTAAFVLRNIFREQIIPDKHAHYRGLEAGHHLPQIDFMAKRKLNHYDFYVDYCRYDLWQNYKQEVLDAMLDRGFKLEVCHHSIGYFFPSDEVHDYGNYGDSTYSASHGSWYHGGQVRIELPEVRKIITDRYLDYVRSNPELRMIGVWPGDSGMPPPEPGLNVADGYLMFWNQIAADLKKEFPDKYLSIIAYLDLLDAPSKCRGAENTQVWFCPIRTNYHYAMTDHPDGRHFLHLLEGWIKCMPENRVNVFDYFGWQAPYTPYARNVGKTLRAYQNLGAGGAYGWVGFTYNLMGIEYRWAKELYAYTFQLWDPKADVDALLVKWAEGVFGAAGPKIAEFYNYVEAEHNKLVKECVPDSIRPWLLLPMLHRMQSLLADARKEAENSAVVRRIDLLESVAVNAAAEQIIPENRTGPKDPLASL